MTLAVVKLRYSEEIGWIYALHYSGAQLYMGTLRLYIPTKYQTRTNTYLRHEYIFRIKETYTGLSGLTFFLIISGICDPLSCSTSSVFREAPPPPAHGGRRVNSKDAYELAIYSCAPL